MARHRVAKPQQPSQPPVGTKRKFTKRNLRAAIKRAEGLRIGCAQILGVHKSAITRAMQRWPDLVAVERQVIESAYRAEVELSVVKRRKAINEDQPWAIRDVIRDHGHIIGIQSRNQVEVSGPNGGPVQHAAVILNLTTDALRLLSPDVRAKILDGDPRVLAALAGTTGGGLRGDEAPAPTARG